MLVPVLLSASAMVAPLHAQTTLPAAAPAFTIDAAARKTVLEAAIAKITANYVFPDKTPAIAKALRRKLASGGFDTISDPKAFAVAVNDTIAAAAHDRHLRLRWSPEPLPPMGARGEPSPAEIAQQKSVLARMNYAIPKVEVLNGNIGYLKIDGFLIAEDAGPTLGAAMAFLQHTDALIFDVRDNSGGAPGMVALTVSYLVPPRTQINNFHRRGEAVDEQFWSLPYVPGGRWSIDKPVYVLTSKDTASGAEEFAYDLQQMKRGTVVGGVTWGGANPGGLFPIDQHFAIFVPTGAAVNPISKTNWEGVGVKPDIVVDPVTALETARHLALEKLIANATDDRAKELQKLLQGQPPQ